MYYSTNMTVISDRLMISFEEKVYIKKCKRKIVETTMIENLSKENHNTSL